MESGAGVDPVLWSTPEDRARAFATRWFRNESPQLQEICRRELAALIRAAIEAAKAQANGAPRAPQHG
jgi:hypothetical protein